MDSLHLPESPCAQALAADPAVHSFACWLSDTSLCSSWCILGPGEVEMDSDSFPVPAARLGEGGGDRRAHKSHYNTLCSLPSWRHRAKG